jgi:hypothetical protein
VSTPSHATSHAPQLLPLPTAASKQGRSLFSLHSETSIDSSRTPTRAPSTPPNNTLSRTVNGPLVGDYASCPLSTQCSLSMVPLVTSTRTSSCRPGTPADAAAHFSEGGEFQAEALARPHRCIRRSRAQFGPYSRMHKRSTIQARS